jgi:DNA-binding NarL/FixJ family response regulator
MMAEVRLGVTANQNDRLASNETFVNRIRILLWKMPPMLLDIITDTIAPQPDMDIVAKGRIEMDLLDAAEQTNADIVITARSAATEYKDYDELLYRHCRIKVLEILDEGRYGSLCEMRPRRVALGEMSPLRLLEAIRGSADIAVGADQ